MMGGWEKSMNLDEEILQATKDMEEAEDALADMGFPVEQWMLIKQYISAAISYRQIQIAKSFEEFKPNLK
jgi:hypothetical protein